MGTPMGGAFPADEDPGLRVDMPFALTLEHRALAPGEMFQVTRAFDFHEVAAGSPLTVDVEKVTPTATTLHVTPQRPMPYRAIAEETTRMLEQVGRQVFGETPRVAELDWILPRHGEHSLGRGSLGRIQ